MNLTSFIVENAADALRQVEAALGPEAVIVSLRKLPARGLGKLWRRYQQVEVLAGVPEPEATKPDDTALDLPAFAYGDDTSSLELRGAGTAGALSRRALLARLGLVPQCVNDVLARFPDAPAACVAEELQYMHEALRGCWRSPRPRSNAPDAHVLIGPPGSGKTTALCKWMAHTVLVEGRSACVWRLDAARANTAEALSVYCAILGVREQRFWKGARVMSADERWFFDVPGVDVAGAGTLAPLQELLQCLPAPHVHLVLNGAYEPALLLAQARSFGVLGPEDLIVTHLDEEIRWTKLWNLPCAGHPLRFLSAGPEIPGRFLEAQPEHLLPGSRMNARTNDLCLTPN